MPPKETPRRELIEVEWEHARHPGWLEKSQVDAPDPDEAVAVVRDSDDGYGAVGRIVSVRQPGVGAVKGKGKR